MLLEYAVRGPETPNSPVRCETESYLDCVAATSRLLAALPPQESLAQAPTLSRDLLIEAQRLRTPALRDIVTEELQTTNHEPSSVVESRGPSNVAAPSALELQQRERKFGGVYFLALVASEVDELRDVALAYLGANRALVDLVSACTAGLRGNIALAADPLLGAPLPTAKQVDASEAQWCAYERDQLERGTELMLPTLARFGVRGRQRQRQVSRYLAHLNSCQDQFLAQFEIQQWIAVMGQGKGFVTGQVFADNTPGLGTNPTGRILPNRMASRADELAATAGLPSALRQQGLAIARDALALDLASRRDGILAQRVWFLFRRQQDLKGLYHRLKEFEAATHSHDLALESTPKRAGLPPSKPSEFAALPPPSPEPPPQEDSPTLPAQVSHPGAAAPARAGGRWVTVGEGREHATVFTRLSRLELLERLHDDVDPGTFARGGRSREVAAAMSLSYHAGKHAPRGEAVEDYLGCARSVFEDEDPRELMRRSDRPGEYARVLRRSSPKETWGVWSLDGRMISFCNAPVCPEEGRRARACAADNILSPADVRVPPGRPIGAP